MEECAACSEGLTSPEGARSRRECDLPEPSSSPDVPHHSEGRGAELMMTQKQGAPTQKHVSDGRAADVMTQKGTTQNDAAHTEPSAKVTTQWQASSMRLHGNQKALDSPAPAPATAASVTAPLSDAKQGTTQHPAPPAAAASASSPPKVQSPRAPPTLPPIVASAAAATTGATQGTAQH